MKSYRWLAVWFFVVLGFSSRAAEPLNAAQVLRALMAINDTQVQTALQRPLAVRGSGMENRANGARISALAASYTSLVSRFHHDAHLLPALSALVEVMQKNQLPDGLYDSGNLDSPPDSAFILETLCQAQRQLVEDASSSTIALREKFRAVILNTAEGVRTGGIHTPNHRWHVCAALAHVHRLYPDPKWVARIDDWLGEGIDLDADGQYAERSPHYTAEVVNPALVTLALLLNRPALLEPVRRSLEAQLYLLESDGELETVASRRQDQRAGVREVIWAHYVPYRLLALRDGNGVFAAVTRWIERDFLANTMVTRSPNAPLAQWLDFAELDRELPASTALPENFTRVFPSMALARVRRGAMSATIYGGSDASTGLGLGSGLATNPTFFKFRKGTAVLESVRMTPAFFSTGFFYSNGLHISDERYQLQQTVNVPYHLPLPAAYRNEQGDYKLSDDGRYFSKLDFEHRPKQFRTLRSTVEITERHGGFDLEFAVDGQAGVLVTIELTFRRDGKLEGVGALPETVEPRSARPGATADEDRADSFILARGMGKFTAGTDTIEFGPGTSAGAPGRMEGEDYTWINGHLRTQGQRVYLTGVTPFRYTLTLR